MKKKIVANNVKFERWENNKRFYFVYKNIFPTVYDEIFLISDKITTDSPDNEDDFDDISSDEVASSGDNDEPNNTNDFTFAPKESILSDLRQFDHTRYEQLYQWLYYSHYKKGFMCKVCTVMYGDRPCPNHGSRGAWSHKGVILKKNPGKKLRRHARSEDHEKAMVLKTNMTIEESMSVIQNEDRIHANELYIGKLVQIVHFMSRNNLSVKTLYPKFVEFLSSELQEPIIKQYLDTCAKNATYISHETCDSLIYSINKYFLKATDDRIKESENFVLYADESTSEARKEMLGIFIGIFDEVDKELKLEYVELTEVSSTKSEIVMQAIEKTLRERNIDISKTIFCCLDGTNSMSGE